MLKPGHYFPEQIRDERIVMFVRKHPLAFLYWTMILTIMFFIPIIVFFIVRDNLNFYRLDNDAQNAIILGVAAYYLFVIVLFFTAWINYYLNVTIVTANHLVDIKQEGLFNRQVAEQSLLRVQDVSSKMRGFLQTLFAYGTVFVETAGEAPNFEIQNIPWPHRVANTIMRLHEEKVESGNYTLDLVEANGGFKRNKLALSDRKPASEKAKREDQPQKNKESLSLEKPPGRKPTLDQSWIKPTKVVLSDNPKKSTDHQEKNISKNKHSNEGELQEGETIEL